MIPLPDPIAEVHRRRLFDHVWRAIKAMNAGVADEAYVEAKYAAKHAHALWNREHPDDQIEHETCEWFGLD